MAKYISANLKRMHFVGETCFKFQDGMLELKDPDQIALLDREIESMKRRGTNPGMEKVSGFEVVKDELPDDDELDRLARLARNEDL